MARPIVIDTDGGVDDAVALWWALTDPDLDVVAVTVVWGNVSVEIATASVLRVAARRRSRRHPRGDRYGGPLQPAPDLRPATFIHGDDGLGNAAGPEAPQRAVDEPATELLARLARERPGELTLVTLGPLTNIGVVVHDHPEFAADIAELLVMGGSARRGGNALPDGEANIAHDPIAAAAHGARAVGDARRCWSGSTSRSTPRLRPSEFELLAEHRTAGRGVSRRAAAFLP